MKNFKLEANEMLQRNEQKSVFGGIMQSIDKGWRCCEINNRSNCSTCTGGWICSPGYVAEQCV